MKIEQYTNPGNFGNISRTRQALVGPPEIWEAKRQFQFGFLLSMGLMPEHTLLDLGCGTLRGGIPIIRYLNNGNYTAVDVRQEVIHEARLELEESGLASKDPVLICIDNVSEMVLESSFDFIWAFSVLIHMEDNVLRGGLQFVRRHLKNQGRFFANVVLGNSHDGHWREFPLVEREASFYQEIFLANDLCMTDLGPLSEFGHTTKVRNDELNKRQHMMKATPVE